MSHVAQRFEAALHALIGDGSIKQRLKTAYTNHLEDLEESDLPASLRAPFGELNAALHRFAPSGKATRVNTSVQKMSFGEAGAHAGTIVRLYGELLRQDHRTQPLTVVADHPQQSRAQQSRAQPSRAHESRERSVAGGS